MCFLSLYSVPVIDGGRSTLISTGVCHVFSKHPWKRLVLMRVKASSGSGNLRLAVWLVRRSGSSTCPAGASGSVSIPWGWLTKQQKCVSQLCCLEVQIRLLSRLGSGSPSRKREALGPLMRNLIPFGLNMWSPMNNPVWGDCQPSGTVDLTSRSGSLRGIPIPDSHSGSPAS